MHAIEFIYSHQATLLQNNMPVCLCPKSKTATLKITVHNRCCHAAARIHRRRTRLEEEPDRRIRLVGIRSEAVRDDRLDRSRRAEVARHRKSLLAADLRNHLAAGRHVAADHSCRRAGCMTRIEGRSSAMGHRVASRSFAAMGHQAASHSSAALNPSERDQSESHSSGMVDQLAGRSSEVQNQSKSR